MLIPGFVISFTFEVPESRFDRDSGESEEGEEEAGEGTPQSSALTEGEFVPDSPTLSPIELKQELPKYLPALQVRRPAAQPGSASPITTEPVARRRSGVPGVVVFHQQGPGLPLFKWLWPGSGTSLRVRGLASHPAAVVGTAPKAPAGMPSRARVWQAAWQLGTCPYPLAVQGHKGASITRDTAVRAWERSPSREGRVASHAQAPWGALPGLAGQRSRKARGLGVGGRCSSVSP